MGLCRFFCSGGENLSALRCGVLVSYLRSLFTGPSCVLLIMSVLVSGHSVFQSVITPLQDVISRYVAVPAVEVLLPNISCDVSYVVPAWIVSCSQGGIFITSDSN